MSDAQAKIVARPSFSERCDKEATRDVVFVLRIRRFVFTGNLPSGFYYSDSSVYREEDRDNEDREPVSIGELYEDYGSEYVVETWHIERVFLSREEGEAWAKARSYRWPDGWQIYGLPAEGELAELIKNT